VYIQVTTNQEFMDEQLRNKLVDWLSKNPKFTKFLKNPILALSIYAEHHPRENIIPDFEFKHKEIEIEGEKLIADYDKKIFEFTVRKPAKYTGKRFGWREFYYGLNGSMLRLAKDKGFTFKINSRGETRYILPDLIKNALANRWIVKWVASRRINIYGIPVSKTLAPLVVEEQNKIQKINDYF